MSVEHTPGSARLYTWVNTRDFVPAPYDAAFPPSGFDAQTAEGVVVGPDCEYWSALVPTDMAAAIGTSADPCGFNAQAHIVADVRALALVPPPVCLDW